MPAPLELTGQPAAPGFARGTLVRLPDAVAPDPSRPRDAPAGRALLMAAIDRAVAQLEALQAAADDEDAAGIIAFQVAMLGDEALSAPALEAIDAGASADAAWQAALAAQLADYEAAEDAYFRARSTDLKDLRDRVLRCLRGAAMPAPALPHGAILAADDLTPSRFLELDWSAGGGIALAAGSAASHVAMLARTRGVPMVVGLGRFDIADHATAALDGAGGLLVLSPDADRWASMAGAAAPAAEGTAAAALLRRPAVTADGERITVLLNLSDPRELPTLDPEICDGIGVVRTEFLFAGPGLPDEATQYAAYRHILECLAGRPVSIRTLDAGGDKPIPGLTPEGESNPFLGVRGLRLSLARPEVFTVQLRALARAAALGPLKIMLPMVTVPAELEAARALLGAAAAALAAEGIAHRIPPLGMMVEVPAAALAIEGFAADFLSIGTNDLTQYVTAAGRDIGAVAALADPANPAVLRLIAEVARHGARAGIEVSVCGDMAGEPAQVAQLLRTGIRTLSMAPNCVGAVKAAIAAFGAADRRPRTG
jgi:phosphotransferase system enzyme I (PtsI)